MRLLALNWNFEMKKVDINYIREFVYEVQAVFEVDEECILPQQWDELIKNVLVILEQEEATTDENFSL